MAKTIHYYFATISPFAYLAGDQLEQKAPGEIVYHPIDLVAVFSATGAIPLAQRSEQRKDYRLIELERIAKRRQMPINKNPKYFPINNRPANCLVLAVRETGGDVAKITQALLTAIWAEERDISDLDTLKAIATEVGVDSALVDQIDQYEALLDQESQQAIEAGVFGSPFYIVDGEPFWGQDQLEHALAAAHA